MDNFLDNRKAFDKGSHSRSAERLAVVRPKLEQYLKSLNPDVRFYPLDDYRGGGDLRYNADIKVFDGDLNCIGFIEDEVRFTQGTVRPGGKSLHVPNRPNKIKTADYYCQFHLETDYFWVAPISVIKTWELQSTLACNSDGLEGFLDGAVTDVDWYELTDTGAVAVNAPHKYLETWLSK